MTGVMEKSSQQSHCDTQHKSALNAMWTGDGGGGG